MDTTQDAIHKAYLQGKQAGENAAENAIEYLWGGRITRGAKECAESFIKASEEGDPRIYDAFTLPNLSGEWADEENPNDLFEKCTGHEYFPDADDHQETMDEICREWEHAVADSFFATLEKSARDFLAEE